MAGTAVAVLRRPRRHCAVGRGRCRATSGVSCSPSQKVTQVVPVRVAITDPRGLQLLPGMNVTVRIHRS
jgi:hypothetical protein